MKILNITIQNSETENQTVWITDAYKDDTTVRSFMVITINFRTTIKVP